MALNQAEFGCTAVLNYKASGHGKGEVDGAATLLKSAANIESLRIGGARFRCAADMYHWCVQHHSDPKSSTWKSR
jgi:hypothetical protein